MGERHRTGDIKHGGEGESIYALRPVFFAVCAALLAFSLPLFYWSPVLAEGLSGWANLNRTTAKQYEDGKKISAQNNLNENYYLRLDKFITPVLSYQIYLRTSLTNLHSTDAEGKKTTAYQRAAEPAIDFFLRNPMYSIDTGYRRLEQWSTTHIRDESRKTSEFYYSRLNVTPYEFPSLMLQYDRQVDSDYLSPRQTDNTSNRYSGNSAYKFPYKNLDLSYNLYYTRNENKTPISTVFKSTSDNFTGLYNVGYSRSIKDGLVFISAVYQGNYVRNKNEQFSIKTGSVSVRRTPLSGLYAKGAATETGSVLPHETGNPKNINQLSSESALTDAFNNPNPTAGYATPIPKINIGQNEAAPDANKYHNIGIRLISSDKGVDTLSIYVTSVNNVTLDTVVGNDPSKWRVYTSNTNSPVVNEWTPAAVSSVSLSVFDPFNRIYRYDIKFSPQNASFFKVVNQDTANVNDVFVTEIEAFGIDIIPSTGKTVDTTTLFNQGLNFNVNLRPAQTLNIALNYLLNRADTNPASVWDSISNIAGDIIKKSSKGAGTGMRSNITKTYGATTTWMAHRLLTTTARIQRNEAYDNRKELDTASNIYSLAFSSAPLPTLNTSLTFIKNDNYSFGAKQSTIDSVLLNIGSKLYRNVNMITDIGYTQTQSYLVNAQPSNSRYLRGSIDATLTPKLFTTLTYGVNSTLSGGVTTLTEEGGTIISYRPSRLVNLSGTFRILLSGGNTTTSEGVLLDWLPFPVIKLNTNYQHTRSEPGPTVSDTFNNYAIWYITKFLDLQLAYSYTQTEAVKNTKSYNIGINLNCRFW
ncbi:MAG: hypothetical protein M1510_14305 [Nitrospirae bacterium]|nr:hypothetical protein [Nitrospirota bacterium]